MKRIAATIVGMGCVSAAGVGCEATLARLLDEPVDPAPSSRLTDVSAVPVFEVVGPELPVDAYGGRTLALLRIAVEEALERASLQREDLAGRRVGVSIGTTVACQLNDVAFYETLRNTGRGEADPMRRFLGGNPAEWLQRDLGVSGPAVTVANACSSGADAIGVAAGWVEHGRCDIAIAGGADELNRVPLAGFQSLGVCSAAPCSPFDRDRGGLNLGEGAGVVVLESENSAKSRGGGSGISVPGFAMAGDGHHITQPLADGKYLERAIRQALERAGAQVGDIAFVNAHGTGTDRNDRVEGNTLVRIFGRDVRYHSTKRFTGHTLGAAGALEVIFAGLMLKHGVVGASAGFTNLPDDIAMPPLTSRTRIDGEYALSTSLAFGGCNSAVVLRRTAP